MGSVSGLGQSYNLPNYVGELYSITPAETPLLSMIGGLHGGGVPTQSKQFTWQTVDNNAAAQPAVLEGADASATERTRSEVINVTQIHQEAVKLSYTKQAAVGNLSGQSILGNQPVQDEETFQLMLKLEKIARDVNYSFHRGVYVADTDINTARQTRGLDTAITTNKRSLRGTAVTSVTATASTDVINKTAHGLVNGQEIEFTAIGSGAAGLSVGTSYWVVSAAANTFKVAATKSGTAIDITTDGTSMTYVTRAQLQKSDFNNVLRQMAASGARWSNVVVFANAYNKQRISELFAYQPMDRTVGGVAIDTVLTDFGSIGIAYDRFVKPDTIEFVDCSVVKPRILEIPKKGFLFTEPLAKTGSADLWQIYGEIGLEYGPELWHGIIVGATSDE